MADENKGITVEQLRDLVERADERLDKLEQGKAAKISPVSISIPISAWTDNTDETTLAEGFAFRADVEVNGLTETDSTDTVLNIDSLEPAKACGMSNTATPIAGAMRYYAVEKPTEDLTADLRVFKVNAQ